MSIFRDLYTAAYNLFRSGKFQEALTKLKEAEENFTGEEEINEVDIEILRGSIGFEMEDLELARYSYEKALKLDPLSAEACIGIGQVFYTVEMKEEAKQMFEWALNNDPENQMAKNALANINKELGFKDDHNSLQKDDAENAETDSDLTGMFDEAYDLFMKNEFDAALGKINALQSKYEEEVKILKGNIYLGMGKTDKAKELFEDLIRNDSACTPASNALAEIYLQKGLINEAKTMYELSLSGDPEDQFALVGLAKINQEMGLSPVHSLLHFFSGNEFSKELNQKVEDAFAFFNGRDFKKSLKLIDEILDQVTDDDETKAKDIISSLLNFRGFNLLALKEMDDAKEDFEKSLKYNPDSSQACAGIGEILYLGGNDKEAKTMFEWSVKNNRNNLFAVAGLAKVNQQLGLPADHNLLDMGLDVEDSKEFNEILTKAYDLFSEKKFNEALESLKSALSFIDPDSTIPESRRSYSSISNFMGFCNLSLNKINDAKVCFEKALQVNPKSSQACAGLGEVFFLMHDEQKAKEMYEWAIKNEPKNKFAVAGLGKVNEILGLEIDNNSLDDEKILKAAEEINKLINDGYELYTQKEFSLSVEKLLKAEEMIGETFNFDQAKDTRASLNNFLGFNYLSLKENGKAKSCFEKALENNPKSSQACAGLGEIYFLSGDDEKSKTMFEWAIENNPQNNFAVSGLSKINDTLGFPKDHNSLKE